MLRLDRYRKQIGILIILITFASAWLIWDYQAFKETPLSIADPGMRYLVPKGASLTSIAADLADKQIISKPNMLIWLGKLEGVSSQLKAGEYDLLPGTTPMQFFNILIGGKVTQYSFTIIEGHTFKDLRKQLRQHPDLVQTVQNDSDDVVMRKLGLPGRYPEGLFLPETYHFIRGTSDLDILARANRALEEYVTTQWQQRDEGLPYASEYDALIMASIIEKETGLPEERPEIAGVFVRRMQKKMRLQTDPTVIYGLGDDYDGNIRRKDLRHKSPYNTYVHKGLPPTPIAMAGKAAIDAALHPKPGTSLYFVARGDGGHVFSDNLRDHNNAVIKYQLNGKKRAFSSHPANKVKQ